MTPFRSGYEQGRSKQGFWGDVKFEKRGSRFEVRGSRFEVRGSRFEEEGLLDCQMFPFSLDQTA